MPTTIIVRESAEHYEAPERATVNLTVELSGYDREHVHSQVADVLQSVRADIKSMRDDQHGPVTWHAISNANTWSWKDDGGTKFTERIEVKAKFNDFARLGEWLNVILTKDGVRLGYINWALTDQRKKELERELRQKVVKLAKEKAEQYADAIDLRIIGTKAVADVGLLGSGSSYQNYSGVAVSRSSALGNAAGVSDSYNFSPEDVLISASIESEFLAE